MKMKNIKNGLPVKDGRYLVKINNNGLCHLDFLSFVVNPCNIIEDSDFKKGDENIFYFYNDGYIKYPTKFISHYFYEEDIKIDFE